MLLVYSSTLFARPLIMVNISVGFECMTYMGLRLLFLVQVSPDIDYHCNSLLLDDVSFIFSWTSWFSINGIIFCMHCLVSPTYLSAVAQVLKCSALFISKVENDVKFSWVVLPSYWRKRNNKIWVIVAKGKYLLTLCIVIGRLPG